MSERWRTAALPSPALDEAGFAGGADGLIFGLLIFVVGTLLVGYAWAVVDTKLAADAAAGQGARTFVEGPNLAAASAGARQAAADALTQYGRTASRADITLAGAGFDRCARVVVTVRYPAPLFDIPFIGRLGSGRWVGAQHAELVDPYRTGLTGVAQCG